MAQAKAAAGDLNVMVHGAYTAQRALEAGMLDELQIHQIPVLFGGGRRLFEPLPSRVELEIVRVIDTPEATHIRHRVRRLVGRSSQQAERQSLTSRWMPAASGSTAQLRVEPCGLSREVLAFGEVEG